jgi:AcrR family transcriptional regulator
MASVRRRLVDAAARVLAEEGPEALSTRRLAREVGTSTMAVYTQFGGMEQLRAELRAEAFRRLAERLRAVPESDDPVRTLTERGIAYCRSAADDPHLYRAALAGPPAPEEDVEAGLDAFGALVESVQRCLDAGRFEPADATALAAQIWTATHGAVSLHLAGLQSFEELVTTLAALWESLGVAFGDARERTRASIAAGIEAASS